MQIWVASNPRGAERLPPDIVTPESDLYLRRLWGDPNEVLALVLEYQYGFQKIILHFGFVWRVGFENQAAVSSYVYGWLWSEEKHRRCVEEGILYFFCNLSFLFSLLNFLLLSVLR